MGSVAWAEIARVYFTAWRDGQFSMAGELDRGSVDVLGPAEDHSR